MDGMWLDVLRAVLYGLVVLVLAGIAFVGGVFTAKKTEQPPLLKIVVEVPAADREAARGFVEAALASRFAGSHGEVLRYLEEARLRNPTMRGLAYQFGLTYLDLDDYEQAETSARRSVERDEETSNAQALRGLILLEKSRAAGTVGAEGPEILARLLSPCSAMIRGWGRSSTIWWTTRVRFHPVGAAFGWPCGPRAARQMVPKFGKGARASRSWSTMMAPASPLTP
jgi:hypothetical protein